MRKPTHRASRAAKSPKNASRAPRVVPGGNWFHCIINTYGAWLYGDPRGFRTRHHREHVDGDYKNPPPPGLYAKQFERSVESLKQPPVTLSKAWRLIVGVAVRDKLEQRGAFVLCLTVSAQHVHRLAKLPRGVKPRIMMGFARKHAKFEVNDRGWEGKLWALRGRELRVKDRHHQLQVYRYILAHANEGAWVWQWKMKKRS
jgi:hypothetical protein